LQEEGEQELRGALRTADAGETPLEDAAVEVAGHHAVEETAPEAVAALEALLPAALDAIVEGLKQLVERGVLGPPGPIDAALQRAG
jgi:hypothetical protein